MAKKQSKKNNEEVKATETINQVKTISLGEVISIISDHNDIVVRNINHHLSMVKQQTGDIQSEDISYVLGLSTRELLFNFTKRLDE